VPFLGRPPERPTALFPQTADALFYALYFQTPGAAEAEFERDVAATLRKVLFAASGDAGPRAPEAGGDATPNPFGMVSRRDGLLAPLPDPRALPAWLSAADLDVYARAFARSGFGGGLNYYRNLDRNWELDAALVGLPVTVPALYVAGERDPGLAIPGMRELIAGMPRLVPRLARTVTLPGCGHWAPQERPAEVNAALRRFLREL
jgi:pimeloyl-ACP methyl ester carboxylesterase